MQTTHHLSITGAAFGFALCALATLVWKAQPVISTTQRAALPPRLAQIDRPVQWRCGSKPVIALSPSGRYLAVNATAPEIWAPSGAQKAMMPTTARREIVVWRLHDQRKVARVLTGVPWGLAPSYVSGFVAHFNETPIPAFLEWSPDERRLVTPFETYRFARESLNLLHTSKFPATPNWSSAGGDLLLFDDFYQVAKTPRSNHLLARRLSTGKIIPLAPHLNARMKGQRPTQYAQWENYDTNTNYQYPTRAQLVAATQHLWDAQIRPADLALAPNRSGQDVKVVIRRISTRPVPYLAFESPYYVAPSMDSVGYASVAVWNATQGKREWEVKLPCLETYPGKFNNELPVPPVSWSSDGRFIAVMGGFDPDFDTPKGMQNRACVQVLDARTGQKLGRFNLFRAFGHIGYNGIQWCRFQGRTTLVVDDWQNNQLGWSGPQRSHLLRFFDAQTGCETLRWDVTRAWPLIPRHIPTLNYSSPCWSLDGQGKILALATPEDGLRIYKVPPSQQQWW